MCVRIAGMEECRSRAPPSIKANNTIEYSGTRAITIKTLLDNLSTHPNNNTS